MNSDEFSSSSSIWNRFNPSHIINNNSIDISWFSNSANKQLQYHKQQMEFHHNEYNYWSNIIVMLNNNYGNRPNSPKTESLNNNNNINNNINSIPPMQPSRPHISRINSGNKSVPPIPEYVRQRDISIDFTPIPMDHLILSRPPLIRPAMSSRRSIEIAQYQAKSKHQNFFDKFADRFAKLTGKKDNNMDPRFQTEGKPSAYNNKVNLPPKPGRNSVIGVNYEQKYNNYNNGGNMRIPPALVLHNRDGSKSQNQSPIESEANSPMANSSGVIGSEPNSPKQRPQVPARPNKIIVAEMQLSPKEPQPHFGNGPEGVQVPVPMIPPRPKDNKERRSNNNSIDAGGGEMNLGAEGEIEGKPNRNAANELNNEKVINLNEDNNNINNLNNNNNDYQNDPNAGIVDTSQEDNNINNPPPIIRMKSPKHSQHHSAEITAESLSSLERNRSASTTKAIPPPIPVTTKQAVLPNNSNANIKSSIPPPVVPPTNKPPPITSGANNNNNNNNNSNNNSKGSTSPLPPPLPQPVNPPPIPIISNQSIIAPPPPPGSAGVTKWPPLSRVGSNPTAKPPPITQRTPSKAGSINNNGAVSSSTPSINNTNSNSNSATPFGPRTVFGSRNAGSTANTLAAKFEEKKLNLSPSHNSGSNLSPGSAFANAKKMFNSSGELKLNKTNSEEKSPIVLDNTKKYLRSVASYTPDDDIGNNQQDYDAEFIPFDAGELAVYIKDIEGNEDENQMNANNWWLVELINHSNRRGYVPGSYFELVDPATVQTLRK